MGMRCRGIELQASRIAVAAVIAIGARAAAEITSVPPAVQPASAVATPVVSLAADGIRAHRIELAPAPADSLRAPGAKAMSGVDAIAPSGQAKPLAIGFPRRIPESLREVRGSMLEWVPIGDGGVAARIEVVSPGAAALRVSLAIDGGPTSILLRGAAADAAVHGPAGGDAIAATIRRAGAYWSPVLEGDTAIIELRSPSLSDAASATIAIERVSHLVVGPRELRAGSKQASEIGRSGACEVDVACVAKPSDALSSAARAVAQVVYTGENGSTLLCVGTLLNDSASSRKPLFLTASHCIDSASAAASVATLWFFDALACGSRAVPPYVQVGGGAALLARSVDEDWALVRLASAPPPGAVFSAWRAEPVAVGVPAMVLHHPQGDLKKLSQAATQPDFYYATTTTSFIQLVYAQGSTEPGSSGAPIFTASAGGAFLELRGGLYGGSASCSNAAGYDVYSRLDVALPLLRAELTPTDATARGTTTVVEYWNPGLSHYFMTTNPAEIADLDSGLHRGWERTGLRFLAWTDPALAPAGTNPVCRFYERPEVGNSHFYSADPAECEQTALRFGNAWIEESTAVFYIQLPNRFTGACPAGTRPVWRFFNRATTNHRYTTDATTRNDMRRTPRTWTAEGYGNEQVIMCAPLS